MEPIGRTAFEVAPPSPGTLRTVERVMRISPTDLYPLLTPEPVTRPVMFQRWMDLTYAHWPVDPSDVQRLLPRGLTADTHDGAGWVGLVAFRMERIRPRFGPAIPYLGTFPETNVRTYVVGPDGRPGVWFHSLDISRLLPVLVAQSTYRLPYMWAAMSIAHHQGTVTYTARRRWPGPRAAFSRLAVRPDRRIAPADVSDLERFLTSRWGLWTDLGGRLAYAPVEHPAWPLHTAQLVDLDDALVEVAGYPTPDGAPLVHYSPGVPVRIGLPVRG